MSSYDTPLPIENVPVPERRVLHDAEGREIGEVEILYGSEETFNNIRHGTSHGRELKSLKLIGSHGVVDVMKEFALHDAKIIVSSERLTNYWYDCEEKPPFAIVPPLESLLDIGIAMHEMGHGEQAFDPKFRDLGISVRNRQALNIMDNIQIGRQVVETVEAYPDNTENMAGRPGFGQTVSDLKMILAEYDNIDAPRQKESARAWGVRLGSYRQVMNGVFLHDKSWLQKQMSDIMFMDRKEAMDGITRLGIEYSAEELRNKFIEFGELFLSYLNNALTQPEKIYVDLENNRIVFQSGKFQVPVKLHAGLNMLLLAENAKNYTEAKEVCDLKVEKNDKLEDVLRRLDRALRNKQALPIHEILGWPTKPLERDASKRALIRLRRIKQSTGFRSFARVSKGEIGKQPNPTRPPDEEAGCVEAFNEELRRLETAGATSDVTNLYNQALRSYDAKKPLRRTRKQDS